MFDLSKWYGDCVSPVGDASIAYSAALRWGAVSLDYHSLLEKRGSEVSVHSAEPQQWSWTPTAAGIRERIFESEDGFIDWDCVCPRATVDTGRLKGLGYREHLHMTVAPWKLPIRGLRWGRYLSDTHSIVWIHWEGEFNTSIVYCNGRRVEAVQITDDELSLADGARVEFDRGFTLREGPLGTTVIAAIPVLNRLAPTKMLAVTECKWLSRARCGNEESWAIHEVVRWP